MGEFTKLSNQDGCGGGRREGERERGGEELNMALIGIPKTWSESNPSERGLRRPKIVIRRQILPRTTHGGQQQFHCPLRVSRWGL